MLPHLGQFLNSTFGFLLLGVIIVLGCLSFIFSVRSRVGVGIVLILVLVGIGGSMWLFGR